MYGKTASELLTKVRTEKPLVHHITNYVTVNDCANITLCTGASPVMAHAVEEVSEMVSYAGALVLNIGTLSPGQIKSMLVAGRRANELEIPVILDPVGAGATKLRTESTLYLLSELDISVLKGNAGEIGVLAGSKGKVRGVDSESIDGDAADIAVECAENFETIVVMSGATDIVTDGNRTLTVENGHEMMGKLSGTGCMAASVLGSFAGVSEDYMLSSASALAAFGLAGEKAGMCANGPYSFRTALFDQLYSLKPVELKVDAKVKEYNGV
ncbi:hydroxyethylthiazole kinase [Methanoplanus sp. FWC-SCC4]|uniref:Hydroxyethylthiazole kinase n=1 Tax=Methanochimaera problematica TaxID=2609417 RepID=A0AA97I557_9EURY|nr:hydroxyethylthiazole kinase [Methanoplanus sp. FWC-SCC4]WOF17101.1 hydroxyethylthiazole kinase [Methanoplanus sp. FWC-SCC4]